MRKGKDEVGGMSVGFSPRTLENETTVNEISVYLNIGQDWLRKKC